MLKKIDIHAHANGYPGVFPPHWRTGECTLTPEELLEMYDRLGIEKGVLQTLVSPEGMLSPVTSECVQSIAQRYPDRFLWFCGVDPRAVRNLPDSDLSYLLNYYRSLGAKGVGEVNANLYADDPLVDNLFFHCAACKMPVTIHMHNKIGGSYGLVDEPGLPRIEKMLQKHPELQLIGHSVYFWLEIAGNGREGKVQEGRLAELMRKYPNLYCDLSADSGSRAMMRDPEYAAAFLDEFQDRVMYGCDITTPTAQHPFVFGAFLEGLLANGAISAEVYRKICRGNAEKLLNI